MSTTQISEFPIVIGKSEIGNEKGGTKMVTQKQLKANRLNAQQSTGPKTNEGKAMVSQNAVKHGVFSKHILLDGESQKEFEALAMEFYEQFHPQSFLGNLILERALAAAWRLSRITQMESMLINHVTRSAFNDGGITDVLSGPMGDRLALLSRYEITLEKILFRSLDELRTTQNSQTTYLP